MRKGRRMGIPPSGGRDCGGGTAGGGDLCLPPPEHSRKVYCDQAHYGTVSGRGAETKATGLQEVVGSRRGKCGGDADGSLVGRTDGGGGGDVRDSNRDGRIIR